MAGASGFETLRNLRFDVCRRDGEGVIITTTVIMPMMNSSRIRDGHIMKVFMVGNVDYNGFIDGRINYVNFSNNIRATRMTDMRRNNVSLMPISQFNYVRFEDLSLDGCFADVEEEDDCQELWIVLTALGGAIGRPPIVRTPAQDVEVARAIAATMESGRRRSARLRSTQQVRRYRQPGTNATTRRRVGRRLEFSGDAAGDRFRVDVIDLTIDDDDEPEQNIDHRDLCKVCLIARKAYMTIPCGHYAYCYDCARHIANNGDRCAICRCRFTTVYKVHE